MNPAQQSTSTNSDNATRRSSLVEFAASQRHVAAHLNCTRPTDKIFNANDPKIKEDIIRMIVQYLQDEGYSASKSTILDEANVKWYEREEVSADVKRVKKAIMEGEWPEVDKLCSKPIVKNHKAFLYSVYKQQYLEYIEHHETQKAFTHLNKRLKPLESYQTTPNEFKDLCYLLTAKSVHEAPSFKGWEGLMPGREKLVEQFQTMVHFENAEREGITHVPQNRLLHLLRQAAAYQIEFSRYHSKISPKILTLLQDYTSTIIPNAVRTTFTGHMGNVKCVEFIGEEGNQIISGSSDNTCRIWDLETGECKAVLEGHRSRIWDVASDKSGSTVASASGDGTVKIWDFKSDRMQCVNTLTASDADLYTVKIHPSGSHLVTAGYDKILKLFDIERGIVVKTFTGHQLSVSKAVFSPMGNLIVSGSKDSTIKFWDIVSGLCIKTISSHLGEVTSVEMNTTGTNLLSCSKDNSNRLWDIRLMKPIKKFKGHQNTSKNFIRASFAGDAMIVGGSEDGILYTWDSENENILQRLRAHEGIVYSAAWSSRQSMLCSCSDDRTIRSWWFDEKLPLFD